MELLLDLGDEYSGFSIFWREVDELPNRKEMGILPLLIFRCRLPKSTES